MNQRASTTSSQAAALAALLLLASAATAGAAERRPGWLDLTRRPHPARSPAVPALGSPRQGGDTCATAVPIPALPFTADGTTSGLFLDDYDEICPFDTPGSPDVVYSFTPPSNVNVDISLCSATGITNYDTKLYVYEGVCPGPVTGCNDDACSSPQFTEPYVSQLTDLTLTGGQTYYIVVDGYGGDAGNYTIEVNPSAVQPPDFWVNSPLDVIADDGLCTLREAITAANNDAPSGVTPGECPAGDAEDTIGLPAGTYTLTIPSTNEDANLNGDLDIRSPITIVGDDPATTVVQAGPTPGSGISGVFHVVNLAGSELTLERVTVRHAVAEAVFHGGGIYNERIANLKNCLVTLNQAEYGGGVRNSEYSQALNVLDSTFSFNTATSSGGAVENQMGLVNIANSTLSGNSAGYSGGAIHTSNGGVVNLTSTTVANNTAGTHGGGVNLAYADTVYLAAVILTGNQPDDCNLEETVYATIDGDTNLVDGTCGTAESFGPVTDFDPVLADNGGPTPTHAVTLMSNAVNADPYCTFVSDGTNPLFADGDPIVTDQRGVLRFQLGDCDIGAFEAIGAVINEVDCLADEGDSREFVELWFPGMAGADLSGLYLVFFDSDGGGGDGSGAKGISSAVVDLAGFTPNLLGFLVVGDEPVNPDVVIGDMATISDGAAAVALIAYPGDPADLLYMDPAYPPQNAELLDALVYDTGQPEAWDLLPYLVFPGQPEVDEAGGGSPVDRVSNQRCPDGFSGAYMTEAYQQLGPSPHLPNYQCNPLCASLRTLPQAEWRMVSLACDEGLGATVASVFGDDLAGTYRTDWVVWERDTANDQYVRLDLASPVEQGPSYWVYTTQAGQQLDTEGQYALTSRSYSVPLTASPTGMNMVGSPFLFDVDVADLLVDDGSDVLPWGDSGLIGTIDSTLWTYTGFNYQAFDGGATPGVLPTGGGVWTRVLQEPCTLLIPPIPTSVLGGGAPLRPPSPTQPRVDATGWRIQVSASSGVMGDPGNYLGRWTTSVDGLDRNDLEELEPFATPYLTLVMPHPEWGTAVWAYTTDLREARASAGGEWSLELRSDVAREVTVTWQVAQGPADLLARSRLVDEETGEEISPLDHGPYTVQMVAPTHRLRWWVNSLPSLEAGPDRELLAGVPLALSVPFLDEDLGDSHTAAVDWGDGTVGVGAVDEVGRKLSAGHTWVESGAWVVEICVTDRMGASACDTLTVTVEPNPDLLFADGFEHGDSRAWSSD